jgi:hypothetical protein
MSNTAKFLIVVKLVYTSNKLIKKNNDRKVEVSNR